MITYHVRPATTDELDALFELRRLAEQSFRAAGLDQWHDTEEGRRVIRKWVERDEMNVISTHAGDIVGCFALSGADLDFWTPEEAAQPALYVYKIIIRPDRRGTGIGDALLDYSAALAEQMGRLWLRVDCWQTNTGLHQYFLDRGFRHFGTRSAEGRNSGWLAQRPVEQRSCLSGVELTDAAPTSIPNGDRYDDPVSATWSAAQAEVDAYRAELGADADEIGASVVLEQLARRLDVRAREQRQRNGMAHRPYTGQNA